MLRTLLNNDAVFDLSLKPYWTVNFRRDSKKGDGTVKEKIPLDIQEFKATSGQHLRGATDDSCLMTFQEMVETFGGYPENAVYHLDAERDGVVIIDVESKCPDDLKRTLLHLPFIYGDISMSGSGFHLMLPCPALNDITRTKTLFKEDNGYFEILIKHFATFTNKPIIPSEPVLDMSAFIAIWDEFALKAQMKETENIDFDETVSLDIPGCDELKDSVARYFTSKFHRTPADYGNDMSRYEFAVIGSLKAALIKLLDVPVFPDLDMNQQIMLVYELAKEFLPYRPKHDERRDGKPWLLYRTYSSFTLKTK